MISYSLPNMALFSEFVASLHASNILSKSAYFPSVPMLSALVVFLWILFRFSVQRKNKLSLRLPPGPFPWPIIGNLNQLKTLPHHDLHELGKKYGPIMILKFGSFPTVLVSSSAMAKEFLKTHDTVFASRPLTAVGKYVGYNFKDVALAPYGPYWRHMRKLCVVGLLNNKTIESLKSVREEEARLFVRSVWEFSGKGKTPVNLTNMFTMHTLGSMWRILSGNKCSFYKDDAPLGNGGEGMVKLFRKLSSLGAKINIGDVIPFLGWMDWISGVRQRLKEVHNSFDQVINQVIEERRMNLQKENEHQPTTTSIIDELLEMKSLDGREITEENIKAIVFDMLTGGVETTATTLSWLMSLVIKTPHVAKKMHEEIESVVGKERIVNEDDVASMEYVQCVAMETLRLYPTVPLMLPHESTKDCRVGGYFIPARSRLILNVWAIGRDPSVWEDPLVFRPERFMGRDVDFVRNKDWFDMLPFGAGRRGCPGVNMAIATINIISAQLLQCFEWSVEGDLDMTEGPGLAMARSVELVALPRSRLDTFL